MAKGDENKFRDSKLLPFLNSLDNAIFIIKEAGAIRGLPDIMGCWNGQAIYLEVKKDVLGLKEDRAVLQGVWLQKFKKAGGQAHFIYPENAAYILEDLAFHQFSAGYISQVEYDNLKVKISKSFSF